MKHNYYDLHAHSVHSEDMKETVKETIELAEHLGWTGICIVKYLDKISDFKEFFESISGLESEIRILIGAEIDTKNPGDIQKKARNALKYADIILIHGGNDQINRAASECHEVDVLCHPEMDAKKDFIHQKNSGIDQIITKLMAERYIALELNFSEILDSHGVVRSQILGRMRQNVMLARKYNTPMIITSGARDKWDLRSPRELMAIGRMLGMTESEARSAVEEIPLKIIQKSEDRKNPNVIMKGLEVTKWGELEPRKEKKMWGWY